MKVLAIDDQPEALKQIERAILAAEGPDGKPYDVAALTDHVEALKRLDAEHFLAVVHRFAEPAALQAKEVKPHLSRRLGISDDAPHVGCVGIPGKRCCVLDVRNPLIIDRHR